MGVKRVGQVIRVRPEAIEAYEAFDRRESGWVKVELKPDAEERKAA